MTTTTQITERPIIFGAPMVRALLSGAKTQTRRVLKPQPTRGNVVAGFNERGIMVFREGWHWDPNQDHHHIWHDHEDQNEGDWAPWFRSMCPHGNPGDRLWVRETFSDPYSLDVQARNFTGFYRATDPDRKVKWKPSIHMPRWASRIMLEITDVRVERLNEISRKDALAEGISSGLIPATGDHPDLVGYMVGKDDGVSPLHKTPQEAFRELWESIYGNGAWDLNPWLWCISFRRLEPA